jgi:hypothetical protein
MVKSNKTSQNKNNQIKKTKQNISVKEKDKSRFETISSPQDAVSSYEDIIDLLSVSPSASDSSKVNWKDQLNDFIILFLKYGFLVGLLTLNFLGLSVSLNCNADQELFTRVASAVFAFFFGFVYLLINYYTYKVMSQGKMCKMNQEKLFPFKV